MKHLHGYRVALIAAVAAGWLAGAGKATPYEDHDYYPAKWKDVHRDRRRGIGWKLYGVLGIQKGDRAASTRQALKNFEFFGAPVGLFVTVDKYLLRGSWADAGMYLQTIMLAARAFGVETCPQRALVFLQGLMILQESESACSRNFLSENLWG